MILRIITATIATYFFAYLFHIRKEHSLFTAIGGGLAQLTFEVCYVVCSNNFYSMFLASIVIALYGEIMARIQKTPVTTYVIAALIPLVPGKAIYDTMVFIVQNNLTAALDMGLRALGYSGLLALGIMIVSTFSRLTLHIHKKHLKTNNR